MRNIYDAIMNAFKSTDNGFWYLVLAIVVAHGVLSIFGWVFWLFGRGLWFIMMLGVIFLQLMVMIGCCMFIKEKVAEGNEFPSLSDMMAMCGAYADSLWRAYGDYVLSALVMMGTCIAKVLAAIAAFIRTLFGCRRLRSGK